ncbi:MAG: hypothetical protein E7457_07140 [Ruminococcaceae bacterium]|nr:hypothetical protein [Oscillospiraceae bacterium]
MEFIIELILEIVFDLGVEASMSRRVPRWVRYILIVLLSLAVLALIGLILFVAAAVMKETLWGGLLLMVIAVVLLVSAVIKFRKNYLCRREGEE